MKQTSTLFLKAVLVIMALGSLALASAIIYDSMSNPPEMRNIPFLLVLSSAIPFIYALYQAFKLLNYIDQNIAFSTLSINALKHIKYAAIVIALIFAAEMPIIYQIAEEDDAPGLILIGAAIVCAPVVVAVFAAVLQKLLQSGIDLKSENDLTI